MSRSDILHHKLLFLDLVLGEFPRRDIALEHGVQSGPGIKFISDALDKIMRGSLTRRLSGPSFQGYISIPRQYRWRKGRQR